ncbi:MAG: hypothetical protein ACLT2C_02630 [Ruminococcus sp.]
MLAVKKYVYSVLCFPDVCDFCYRRDADTIHGKRAIQKFCQRVRLMQYRQQLFLSGNGTGNTILSAGTGNPCGDMVECVLDRTPIP